VLRLLETTSRRGFRSLAVVEVERVSVEVLDGELTDAPGLRLEGVGDGGTCRLGVLVGGVDVFGEDPVDGWLEGGSLRRRKIVALPFVTAPISLPGVSQAISKLKTSR
jgi:hypothetical protein